MTHQSDVPEGEQVPDGAAVFPFIPAELGVDPLTLAVLHAVVFLVGSTEEVIHPAAAEEALEYIIGYLHRLPPERIRQLREELSTLVALARSEGWPKQDIRFLRDFLKEIGLTNE